MFSGLWYEIKTGKISSLMKLKWQRLLGIRNKGSERRYGLSKVTQQFCFQVGQTPKSWYQYKVLSPPWWSWPFPYLPLLCLSSVSVQLNEAREFQLDQGCPKFILLGITDLWDLWDTFSLVFLLLYVVSSWETWAGCCWSTWMPTCTNPCTSSWPTSPCWTPAILSHWPQDAGGPAAATFHHPLHSLCPIDICVCWDGRFQVLPVGSHGLWPLCGNWKPPSLHHNIVTTFVSGLTGSIRPGRGSECHGPLYLHLLPELLCLLGGEHLLVWYPSTVGHLLQSQQSQWTTAFCYLQLHPNSQGVGYQCPMGSLPVLWYACGQTMSSGEQPLPVAPTSQLWPCCPGHSLSCTCIPAPAMPWTATRWHLCSTHFPYQPSTYSSEALTT